MPRAPLPDFPNPLYCLTTCLATAIASAAPLFCIHRCLLRIRILDFKAPIKERKFQTVGNMPTFLAKDSRRRYGGGIRRALVPETRKTRRR